MIVSLGQAPLELPARGKAWLLFFGSSSAGDVIESGWHRGPNPLAEIHVPYAAGRIEPGDLLYPVSLNWPGTRFEILGRIQAGRVRRSRRHIDRGKETDLVAARRGTATRGLDGPMPSGLTDRLRYARKDGSVCSMRRRGDGSLESAGFQARSSVRELVTGWQELEEMLAAGPWNRWEPDNVRHQMLLEDQ